jgi:hypothetical protein
MPSHRCPDGACSIATMKERIDQLLRQQPGLRAKEIAGELAVAKSEVSAFLHRHKDWYHQDADYRWRIAASREIGIVLPGSTWVTADALERTLATHGDLLDADAPSITIHVPEGCSLLIDCTARLLALLNQLAYVGKFVTIDFTKSELTKSYLDRAGFFDHLDQKVTVLPSRPTHSAALRLHGQSTTLVEFGSVDPKADNLGLIEELTEKFVQQSSEVYRVAALTVFGELIGNVAEHSHSPVRGFAGLQKYGRSRSRILTVVSDSGLGIAETLRPALSVHYPDLFREYGEKSLSSDIGLVGAAMSRGSISRYGGARGLGFKSSREQAFKFPAKFSVRQERFCVRFTYEKGKVVTRVPQSQLTRLPGTHICFDFQVD